jgi:hypothetical protein
LRVIAFPLEALPLNFEIEFVPNTVEMSAEDVAMTHGLTTSRIRSRFRTDRSSGPSERRPSMARIYFYRAVYGDEPPPTATRKARRATIGGHDNPASLAFTHNRSVHRVIYRPTTELQSHYAEAALAQQFDAFLGFDETTAITPLAPCPRDGGLARYLSLRALSGRSRAGALASPFC